MGDFLFKFVKVLKCFLSKYFVDFEIINFVWYGCNLKKKMLIRIDVFDCDFLVVIVDDYCVLSV